MEHLKIPAHGISIHALLAESDISVFWTALSRPLFLSTLSLRRATPVRDIIQWEGIFLSTLSLRRATLRVVDGSKSSVISIHALLAESDSARPETRQPCAISIHALLAESDLMTSLLVSMSC